MTCAIGRLLESLVASSPRIVKRKSDGPAAAVVNVTSELQVTPPSAGHGG
jgi:hypothetical protein